MVVMVEVLELAHASPLVPWSGLVQGYLERDAKMVLFLAEVASQLLHLFVLLLQLRPVDW
jgi:hypothetical protein